jgi:hypothetical protein
LPEALRFLLAEAEEEHLSISSFRGRVAERLRVELAERRRGLRLLAAEAAARFRFGEMLILIKPSISQAEQAATAGRASSSWRTRRDDEEIRFS